MKPKSEQYLSFLRAVNNPKENITQKEKSNPPPGKKAKKKKKKKAVKKSKRNHINKPQPIIKNTSSASKLVGPGYSRGPTPGLSNTSVNFILRDTHANVQGPCDQQGTIRPFIGQSALQAVPNVGNSSLPVHTGGLGNSSYSEPPTENLYGESQVQRGQESSINQRRKRPHSDGDPGHSIGEGPNVEKIRRVSYEDRDGSNWCCGSHRGFDETQLPRGAPVRKRPCISNVMESTPHSSSNNAINLNKRMRKSVDHTNQEFIELDHQAETSKHRTNLSPMMSNNNVQNSDAEELAIHELAIVTDNYPLTMLTFDQFDTVQMAVFEKLEATPDPLPVVNLRHLNCMGAIPVTCVGRDSANFLYTFDGQIIKGNLKLKVIESADLPKPIKMMWKSPNVICKDLNRVLRMLQRCNSGLRTAFWKVLRTWLHPESVRRLVIIDSMSAEYIRSQNYSIPDGLFRSKFRMFRPSKAYPDTKQVATQNTCQNTVVARTEHNRPQSYLVPCEADKEKLQPPHPVGGELECSLYEIREPLITIDLTEDLPCKDITGEFYCEEKTYIQSMFGEGNSH